MDESPNHSVHHQPFEGIDLNKLRNILRNNWLWIILLFLLTNSVAFLVIRYTQDLYESASELKLDIKQDASELGFSEFLPDRQKVTMISGEIEVIHSKSFLSQVIDSLNLQVSYYSIGKFLNTELYTSTPFVVAYEIQQSSFYNTPISINLLSNTQFELQVGKSSNTITGTFNDTLELNGLKLLIQKKPGSEFHPENKYSFVINSREALLGYLSKNLLVEPLKFNANTIRISFKDNNPQKARDLVNDIDSIYLSFSHQQKNLANKQKIEWLSAELKDIETQMESYESYFEDFTLENRTSDLSSDLQKTIELINAIDSQRFEISRRLMEVNRLMDAVARGDYFLTLSQQSFFPDALNVDIGKLQELSLEMNRMKLSYNETTFAYRRQQNEIDNLQTNSLTQLSDLRSSWLQKQHDLTQSKTKLERDFAEMPDKNTQYNKNQRFYKLYEAFYMMLMQNRSQFEIAQAGSTPDYKILSTANLPEKPISPNRPIIYGIGFVAGIVLNIFFIGILYLTNTKINNLNEIEQLSRVPFLGVVPALPRSNNDDLYIASHPKSMVSEAIRTLRTNLDFFKTDSPQKVIAISSTVSGEGKSFIAMNLGGVMALSKKKVVLLDLDMRKQKDSSHFSGIDRSKGISTILIGKNTWGECLAKSSYEYFDFIPAGPQPPNPSELLLNGEFSQLLSNLKKNYDYILLDTPPVGVVTDGIMAMKQADISLYIFRANYSKKEFIDNLHRIVRINKLNNITTILNALPFSSETAYGYGYYEEEKKSWIRSIFKRSV